MRNIALAVASLLVVALATPVVQSVQAQESVTVIKRGDTVRKKKVVIRRDAPRAYGKSVTVVKKKPGKTVIKRYE